MLKRSRGKKGVLLLFSLRKQMRLNVILNLGYSMSVNMPNQNNFFYLLTFFWNFFYKNANTSKAYRPACITYIDL